jgi:hypothetical protein
LNAVLPKDEDWLQYVGDNQLALITKDRNIRKKPNEKALLLKTKSLPSSEVEANRAEELSQDSL